MVSDIKTRVAILETQLVCIREKHEISLAQIAELSEQVAKLQQQQATNDCILSQTTKLAQKTHNVLTNSLGPYALK